MVYMIGNLGKGGYAFGRLGLSVCLCVVFVDNITQIVMNGLGKILWRVSG